MLFKIIKQVIANGDTDGLEEKIDGFYVEKKLTKKEYNELIGLLRTWRMTKPDKPMTDKEN